MSKLTVIDRWTREDKLRKAEVAYICDPQRQTAEWWWEQLCSRWIPLQTFLRRARLGQWIAKREQFWEGVKQATLLERQQQLVTRSLQEIRDLEEMREAALDMVRPIIRNGQKYFPVKPKSFEAVLSALVRVDKRLDEKRQQALSRFEPEIAPQLQEGARSTFTQDETRDIARFVLERRFAAQQARLVEVRGGTDGDSAAEAEKEAAGEEGSEESL